MAWQISHPILLTYRTLLVVIVFIVLGYATSVVIGSGTATGVTLQNAIQGASAWSYTLTYHGTLHRFYLQRGFKPMWVSRDRPLPRAERLLQVLKGAEQEGLAPTAYSIELIENQWKSADTPAELAILELRLSNAALNYGRDLLLGSMPPATNHPLWYIEQEEFDAAALLEMLSNSDDLAATFMALTPRHPAYQRLRNTLSFYQQLALLGGWPTIPPGPTLRVGDKHPQVMLLRVRLFIEGDLVLDISEDRETFDELLKLAVERFQIRHGLEADGVVGPATREAMNVSIEQRIEQLKVNMERWRWLPHDLGRRYILVNIPAYQLIAYEEGKPEMVMEVIVGRRDRPTPIISGKLHSVVFNPYWGVPRIILIKDLLPSQRRDPDFMIRRNIRVYEAGMEIDPRTVDWNKISFNYLPYVLRQDPGPQNPMGQVKFLFNNRFDVYLHDTPQQGLFNRTERALSSGCIRVSQPEKLARFILNKNSNGWDKSAMHKALTDEVSQTVTVNTPIPVYLLYFTAWVGSDNRAHFRNDIYQLDDSIVPAFPAFQELTADIAD